MMTLEVNGRNFSGFTSLSATRSIDTMSGSFSVDATHRDMLIIPIRVQSLCRVLIDGQPIINGYIEKISPSYDTDSHPISISGRDKTGDVIDSTLGNVPDISADIQLTDIIKELLSKNGLDSVGVINSVGDLEPFKQSDIEEPAEGDRIFDFIELLARKRQVILSSDGNGNIELIRASQEILPDQIINIPGESNIKSASSSTDFTNRFNRYVVTAQGNAVGENNVGNELSAKELATRRGESIDAEVRNSRTLHIVSEENYDIETATNRAIWEQNIRRARGFSYTCTVQGHLRPSGGVWTFNKLIRVNDVFSDIQSTLLINSITYNSSVGGGTTTDLTLVSPDAYLLQPSETKLASTSNIQGSALQSTQEQVANNEEIADAEAKRSNK